MRTLTWVGALGLTLLAASCAPTVYDTGTPTSSGTYDVTSFNGQWQLVTNRSDYGQSWTDDRTRFDSDNTWGPSDRTRYGGWFLPDEFRIDGDRRNLHIEDTGGGVIADLAFDDVRYSNTGYDTGVHAHWVSRRQFEVQRTGQRRSITQEFALQNRGRQLVVTTQVDRDGNTRSYTRVYERV